MSSGIGCLRLAVSKRGVCLIESCLGSSGLALGGIEILLEGLDVDSAECVLRGVVYRLRGGGVGLSLLVLALGGVRVRVGRGIGVARGILFVDGSVVGIAGRTVILLCLCQLILKLLQLLLLLLRAACIVGGIDVVVQELLELGDSEIGLSVISAVIEYCYLGIGILSATGCNTDGFRSGIDDVEIMPTLLIDAVVVLGDIIGIISVAAEFVAILRDVLIECLFLLGIEAGVGPAEGILSFSAGICTAAAGKIFTVIIVAARVSPDVR